MTAYAVTATVLAVIGFLVRFARSQRRSALLAVREAEIRHIATIQEEGKKIDALSERKLDAVDHPGVDPRAMWLRDQKRLPDVSGAATSGDPV